MAALITLSELIDLVLMTFVVGYIFSDFFIKREPLRYKPRFDINAILIASAITAPAIILHEFAHKFVALYFNLSAVFHAAYGWLLMGAVLKILNTGFMFFVPAYVSISGAGTNLNYALIALSGPLMNGILWLICTIIIKLNLTKSYGSFLYLMKRINGFLFVLNMLPIPGFDGFNFYYNIGKLMF